VVKAWVVALGEGVGRGEWEGPRVEMVSVWKEGSVGEEEERGMGEGRRGGGGGGTTCCRANELPEGERGERGARTRFIGEDEDRGGVGWWKKKEKECEEGLRFVATERDLPSRS